MNPRTLSILGMATALALVAYAASPSAGPVAPNPPILRSPIRLAQMNNGHLLIADYYQQRIVECQLDGLSELDSFAIQGRPLAVASCKGRIYVGNETAHRVEAYNRDGEKLFDLGGADGEFQKPTDMAVDSKQGLLFVVDGLDAKVKIFDITSGGQGNLVGTIPPQGATTNHLIHPTGVAVDPATAEVLVSDFGDPNLFVDPAILVFDYQGNLTNTISGSSGMLGERFSRPQGMALRGNRIYLVDSWMGQVYVLERLTGIGLAAIGTHGAGPGQLDLPLDVVIDGRSDDVFVTSYQNKRVEVFVSGAKIP